MQLLTHRKARALDPAGIPHGRCSGELCRAFDTQTPHATLSVHVCKRCNASVGVRQPGNHVVWDTPGGEVNPEIADDAAVLDADGDSEDEGFDGSDEGYSIPYPFAP